MEEERVCRKGGKLLILVEFVSLRKAKELGVSREWRTGVKHFIGRFLVIVMMC